MRMDDMNKWFEDKGFEVKREYKTLGTKGYYEFTISKNNNHVLGTYSWPEDQPAFMRRMVKSYENEFGHSAVSNIQTMDDLIKYANSRCCDVTITKCERGVWEVTVECGIERITQQFNDIYPGVLCEAKLLIDKLTTRDRNDGLSAYAYAISVAAKEITHNYIESIKKEEMIRSMFNDFEIMPLSQQKLKPQIKDVIFNDPATIVLWSDGTKTVVKCQDGDEFNPETGLAMAISKKALGNKGNYCNEFKKWLPESEAEKEAFIYDIKLPDTNCMAKAVEALRNFGKQIRDMNKKSAVQKAYDLAIEIRDEAENEGKTLNYHDINAIIGYLGEALED